MLQKSIKVILDFISEEPTSLKMPQGGGGNFGGPSAFERYMLGRPVAIAGIYGGRAYAIAISGDRVAVSDTWSTRSNVLPRSSGSLVGGYWMG